MVLSSWVSLAAKTTTGLGFAYLIGSIVYNLFFHPLARFPGPRLAAATRFYEWYYSFFHHGGGRFTDRLEQLHRHYGPIVRISPFEVHILGDSKGGMYDELFNFSPELDKKQLRECCQVGSRIIVPTVIDKVDEMRLSEAKNPSFATHRMRRKAWNGFFSKAAISRLEPQLIRPTIETLCTRLREAVESGSVVNLSLLFRCVTFDIVCDYALPEGFGMLENPSEHDKFFKAFHDIFKILGLIQQAPAVAISIMLLRWVNELLPDKVRQNAPSNSGMNYINIWQESLGPRVRMAVEGKTGAKERPSLVEEYLRNPNLPASEKTEVMLRNNVLMFVAAGMETTGYALSTAAFQLYRSEHSSILHRLREEVDSIWPTDDSLPVRRDLEKLPYLTAVIKESLRLSVGVMRHLHRINHHRAMQYKDWTIPPGTSISMSQFFILYDPNMFPQPREFRPERWMEEERSKTLDKYLVVFSRGARNCIGAEMAWSELYITLAALVHRFEFELYDTNESYVLPTREFFIPAPENEDGVRAVVKNRS